MNPNVRAQEILGMFQRYLSSGDDEEISAVTLEEIRSADEQLGERDVSAGFRIAMQIRTANLQGVEQRRHESKIRVFNLVTGIILGLVIAGLSVLLFGG